MNEVKTGSRPNGKIIQNRKISDSSMNIRKQIKPEAPKNETNINASINLLTIHIDDMRKKNNELNKGAGTPRITTSKKFRNSFSMPDPIEIDTALKPRKSIFMNIVPQNETPCTPKKTLLHYLSHPQDTLKINVDAQSNGRRKSMRAFIKDDKDVPTVKPGNELKTENLTAEVREMKTLDNNKAIKSCGNWRGMSTVDLWDNNFYRKVLASSDIQGSIMKIKNASLKDGPEEAYKNMGEYYRKKFGDILNLTDKNNTLFKNHLKNNDKAQEVYSSHVNKQRAKIEYEDFMKSVEKPKVQDIFEDIVNSLFVRNGNRFTVKNYRQEKEQNKLKLNKSIEPTLTTNHNKFSTYEHSPIKIAIPQGHASMDKKPEGNDEYKGYYTPMIKPKHHLKCKQIYHESKFCPKSVHEYSSSSQSDESSVQDLALKLKDESQLNDRPRSKNINQAENVIKLDIPKKLFDKHNPKHINLAHSKNNTNFLSKSSMSFFQKKYSKKNNTAFNSFSKMVEGKNSPSKSPKPQSSNKYIVNKSDKINRGKNINRTYEESPANQINSQKVYSSAYKTFNKTTSNFSRPYNENIDKKGVNAKMNSTDNFFRKSKASKFSNFSLRNPPESTYKNKQMRNLWTNYNGFMENLINEQKSISDYKTEQNKYQKENSKVIDSAKSNKAYRLIKKNIMNGFESFNVYDC